jgi:NADPH:quinone reductase
VRVEAISLNRGEVRRAGMAEAGWRPGWDLAGTIEQPAADGSGLPAGARVVGLLPSASWAETVAVPTDALAALPDAVCFAQAATLPVAGLTALYALEQGGNLSPCGHGLLSCLHPARPPSSGLEPASGTVHRWTPTRRVSR